MNKPRVAIASLLAATFTALIGMHQGDDGLSPAGGLATLYHLDPITRTVTFESGAPGGMFQDYMAKNHQSDLDFGHYRAGAFTVGIEGGRVGSIRDLGSLDALQAHHGYRETMGGGQGFASIQIVGANVMILSDYESQRLSAVGELSALLPYDSKHEHADVHLGHVYLTRLKDEHDPSFASLVKFLVVDHVPGIRATIRWQRLDY